MRMEGECGAANVLSKFYVLANPSWAVKPAISNGVGLMELRFSIQERY
jgi:hypothetical protein